MRSDTVTEIALALSLPDELRARWATRLCLARSAQDSAAVAAVRDVPAPVPSFAGRTAELDTLAEVVAALGRAWISGMAGACKTQLALRLAEHLASHGTLAPRRRPATSACRSSWPPRWPWTGMSRSSPGPHLDEAEPLLAEDGHHVLRRRLATLRAQLS